LYIIFNYEVVQYWKIIIIIIKFKVLIKLILSAMDQEEGEMDGGPYSSEKEFKQVTIYFNNYIATYYNSQSLVVS